MAFLDKVRKGIVAALDERRHEESRELTMLREIFSNNNGGRRFNQWYRTLNQSGDVVGFTYICLCGNEYPLLHVADWLGKTNTCPQCKHEFDLFKSAGITSETKPSEYQGFLAALPALPRLSGKAAPPSVVEIGNDASDTVSWEGSTYTADLSSGDPFAASFRK
jgi:hypothetical protein